MPKPPPERAAAMTLSGQLLAGITACFLALLVGIEVIHVSQARSHLEQQLDAHANETATALALALGSRLGSLEPASVEVIVNPVFDRGHFELIEVRSARGESVFARRLENAEIEVPAWFVRLAALQAPAGEALVIAGWRQLGSVQVKLQPQFAYRQLYDTAVATLAWLCALFALALLLMRAYLAGILRPLRAIEAAALSISNRDFVSIDAAPRVRELRRVTDAMNGLSAKIRDTIAEETARAERLSKEALDDPLTGELNRRGFDRSLAAALDDHAQTHGGALALFAMPGLDEFNRMLGMSKGDAALRQLSGLLAAPAATGTAVVGRWQGPNQAAFLANVDTEPARAWAEGICSEFSRQAASAWGETGLRVRCGIAHFEAGSVSAALLGLAAEAALRGALASNAPVVVEQVPVGDEGTHHELADEVRAALDAGRVQLLHQVVLGIADGQRLQVEFMSRLADHAGQPIAAGVFVPVAARYGLLPALDRRVIESVLTALPGAGWLPHTVSVNVSLQSVADAGFRGWLQQVLRADATAAQRMVFEMTAGAAAAAPQAAIAFAGELKALGSRLAIDNFDVDRSSIALVYDLLPAYVKLAPVFSREIGVRDDARFILEAVLRGLRPLDIPVIAQGIEDQSLVAVLAAIGVSGYQGYAAGRPEPLQG